MLLRRSCSGTRHPQELLRNGVVDGVIESVHGQRHGEFGAVFTYNGHEVIVHS